MRSLLRCFAAVLVLTATAPAAALAQSRAGAGAGAGDQQTIEELKKLLDEARKLQEQQQAAGVEAPKPEGEGPAKGQEADEAAAPAPVKKNPVRPGCMYSGRKLIWEKVPGSCRR